MDKGLLLSTSDTWGHEGPNELTHAFGDGVGYDGTTTTTGTPFDIDIKEGVIITDATKGGTLEFDFCPAVGKASFDYIFGSDEYPEFTNTQYNDGFGFFVSGPYETAAEAATEGQVQTSPYTSTTSVPGVTLPAGRRTIGSTVYDGKNYSTYYQYNIAQLPNGDPVSVNWTNWGWRSAYNQGDANSCTSATGWTYFPWDTTGVSALIGPGLNLYTAGYSNTSFAMNPMYHRAVCDSSAMMELDGITTKLTAVADSLIPGKWYHLKMVICQKDYAHGDGVFLSNLDLGVPEANINNPYMTTAYFDQNFGKDKDGNPFLYEGCDKYVMTMKFDSTAAKNKADIDISYINMNGSAIQNLKGEKLFPGDSLTLTGASDTVRYYPFKLSTDYKGYENGQYIGLVVTVRGGSSDTAMYSPLYKHAEYEVKYTKPTLGYAGRLELTVTNGSPGLHRKIDGDMEEELTWELNSAPKKQKGIKRRNLLIHW